MKFEIGRASNYCFVSEIPPIKNAYKEQDKKHSHLHHWYIDIYSLEELMNLIDNEGMILLDKGDIIIYDDYLEQKGELK